MHSYLRAIGFSKVNTRADLDKIIGMVMDQPTVSYVTSKSEKTVLTEISRDFSERMGITLRGEYDEKGFFHLEHYFPHFRGQVISTKEEVAINKRVDTDAYTGMCDDIRLGVSLIFYLQNVIDYIDLKKEKGDHSIMAPITLSGLSTSGKILFGINKDEKEKENKTLETKKRNKLIADARNGDQEAIDSLTIDDIDLLATVSRRAKQEDIYSIVDTSFIPYGSESDNYSIVGTIMDVKLIQNELTKESIYDLIIECNDLIYEICINKIDILGEPEVGRRFKGNIWMQGFINFSE
ncbi:uncharacterized protein DUF3881 [Mobilisporobacter senegalensis]|uniref:Uncharacterized protein DUF3881 n=1 Tax=Mobilisporobacter senegalensis TaxID=1329262 RepID=A0A3N1XBN4_9FIRM|nr:DUF3881 family protein [Mobilisporobacter senegalensis]ROR22147.1 uncharacterized protein DUF3881 [Mobilisporobacter senegalensis]